MNVIIPDAKSNPNLVVNKPLRLLMSFRINYIHPFCEKKCLIHALFCCIVYSFARPLRAWSYPLRARRHLFSFFGLSWGVLIKYRFSFERERRQREEKKNLDSRKKKTREIR